MAAERNGLSPQEIGLNSDGTLPLDADKRWPEATVIKPAEKPSTEIPVPDAAVSEDPSAEGLTFPDGTVVKPEVTDAGGAVPPVVEAGDKVKVERPEAVEKAQRDAYLIGLMAQFAGLSSPDGAGGARLNPDAALDQYTPEGKRAQRRKEFGTAAKFSIAMTGGIAVGTGLTVGAVAALPVLVGGAIGFGVSQGARKLVDWYKGRKSSGGRVSKEAASQGQSWQDVEDELGQKIYETETASTSDLSRIAREALELREDSPEFQAKKLEFIQALNRYAQTQEQLAPDKQRHADLIRKTNRWKLGLGLGAAVVGGGLYSGFHAMREASQGIYMAANHGLGDQVNNAVHGLRETSQQMSQRLVEWHGGLMHGQVAFHYSGAEHGLLEAAGKIPGFLITPAAEELFRQGMHVGGPELAKEFWKQIMIHTAKDVWPALLAAVIPAFISNRSRQVGPTGAGRARERALGLSQSGLDVMSKEAEADRVEAHLKRNPELREYWDKYKGKTLVVQNGAPGVAKGESLQLDEIANDSSGFIFRGTNPPREVIVEPAAFKPMFLDETGEPVFYTEPEPGESETAGPEIVDAGVGNIYIDEDNRRLKLVSAGQDPDGSATAIFQVVDEEGNPIEGTEPVVMTADEAERKLKLSTKVEEHKEPGVPEVVDDGLNWEEVDEAGESPLLVRTGDEYEIDDKKVRVILIEKGTSRDAETDKDGDSVEPTAAEPKFKLTFTSEAGNSMTTVAMTMTELFDRFLSQDEAGRVAFIQGLLAPDDEVEVGEEEAKPEAAPDPAESLDKKLPDRKPEPAVPETDKKPEDLTDEAKLAELEAMFGDSFNLDIQVEMRNGEQYIKSLDRELSDDIRTEILAMGFERWSGNIANQDRIPLGATVNIRKKADGSSIEIINNGKDVQVDFEVSEFAKDGGLKEKGYHREGYFFPDGDKKFDENKFIQAVEGGGVIVRAANNKIYRIERVKNGANLKVITLNPADLSEDPNEKPIFRSIDEVLNKRNLSDWYVKTSLAPAPPAAEDKPASAEPALVKPEPESTLPASGAGTVAVESEAPPAEPEESKKKPELENPPTTEPEPEPEVALEDDKNSGAETPPPDFEQVGNLVKIRLNSGRYAKLAPGSEMTFVKWKNGVVVAQHTFEIESVDISGISNPKPVINIKFSNQESVVPLEPATLKRILSAPENSHLRK